MKSLDKYIAMPSVSTRKWSHYLPIMLFITMSIVYLTDYIFITYRQSSIFGIVYRFNELLHNHVFDFYGVIITLSSVIITVMITIMTIIAGIIENIERRLIQQSKKLYEENSRVSLEEKFHNVKKDAYAVSLWVIFSMILVLIFSLTGYILTISSTLLFFVLIFFLLIGITNFILASLFVMGLIRVVLFTQD